MEERSRPRPESQDSGWEEGLLLIRFVRVLFRPSLSIHLHIVITIRSVQPYRYLGSSEKDAHLQEDASLTSEVLRKTTGLDAAGAAPAVRTRPSLPSIKIGRFDILMAWRSCQPCCSWAVPCFSIRIAAALPYHRVGPLH